MSGIFGIFNTTGKSASYELVQRMNAAQQQLGPDGEGTLLESNVALGHQLLHTTPESLNECQPVARYNGCRMVFDGRVDNRDDVRTSLAAAGIRQPSANDAELVLDAYCV